MNLVLIPQTVPMSDRDPAMFLEPRNSTLYLRAVTASQFGYLLESWIISGIPKADVHAQSHNRDPVLT